MTYYEKAGKRWNGGRIILDDRMIINPTHEQLIAAGYEAKEPQPYEPTLEEVKTRKIAEIDAYDTSTAVNSFILDGNTMWLDKATRVGLVNSLNCEKAVGREETTLWFGTTPITLNVDLAQKLLAAVELYALECFGVTAKHKANVDALATIEEVNAYDHTTGYPEKLNLSTAPQEETLA